MRKNTKVVIWTVVICFALWGGFSIGVQFQKRGRIAGEIFGKDVSFQEYGLFEQANRIFNFGDADAPQTEASLRQKTWQSLLYSREAKRRKIEVRDEEVRGEILKLLENHQVKDPSPAIYESWLAMNVRETPQEFEKQMREILRIQKLIKKVNEQPVPRTKIDEETALLQFRSEHDLLSAEMILFPSIDEANAFRAQVKNADDWKKETEKMAERVKSIAKISLGAWTRDFKVPPGAVERLHRAEKGSVSEPVRIENEYAAFLVQDKHTETLEKFESVLKEQYLKELEEKKKYERFLMWHLELERKANRKDYLPPIEAQSESGLETPSSAPAPSSGASSPSAPAPPAAPSAANPA